MERNYVTDTLCIQALTWSITFVVERDSFGGFNRSKFRPVSVFSPVHVAGRVAVGNGTTQRQRAANRWTMLGRVAYRREWIQHWKHTPTQQRNFLFIYLLIFLPSVLCRCWLGGRKGIRPVKKLSSGVLVCLSVWREMQTCIWTNRFHCHSLSLVSVKSRLVLPFWYRLTRKKGR